MSTQNTPLLNALLGGAADMVAYGVEAETHPRRCLVTRPRLPRKPYRR
jgi:hypothetical protein